MVVIKTGTETIQLRHRDRDKFDEQRRLMRFYEAQEMKLKALRRKKKGKNKKRRAAKIKLELSYIEYMKSEKWAKRRARFFKTHRRKCSICGDGLQIELHHIVYSKQGAEPDEHLTPLCRWHHLSFHEQYGSAGNMSIQWEEFKLLQR